MKCYSELILLDKFEDRLKYLQTNSKVGEESFGCNRWINQQLYRSQRWKDIRRKVIIRDNGCDLGDEDRPISGKIIVHHINPISKDMIVHGDSRIFDMENLISVSNDTHQMIHYNNNPKPEIKERRPNDMCPWRE